MQQRFSQDALVALGQRTVEAETECEERFQAWLGPQGVSKVLSPSADPSKLEKKFDAFIIFEAGRNGTAVLEYPSVRRRLQEWHDSPDAGESPDTGIELLIRFGSELVRSAEINRENSEIKTQHIADNSIWYRFKEAIVHELDALQRQARAAKLKAWPDLMLLIEKHKDKPLDPYSHLNANTEGLRRFEQAHKRVCMAFLVGEIKGGGFFNEWGAYSEGLDVESFRQRVSKSGQQIE